MNTRNVALCGWVAFLNDVAIMGMSFKRIDGVCGAVVYVDVVREQEAVTDFDRLHRP